MEDEAIILGLLPQLLSIFFLSIIRNLCECHIKVIIWQFKLFPISWSKIHFFNLKISIPFLFGYLVSM